MAAYSPGGQSLVYSTLIGGSQQDGASAVAVDAAANVYVAGTTSSADLPVTNSAYQHTFGGSWDAFLMVIGPVSASPAPSVTATPQVLSFTAPGNAAQPALTVTLTAAPGAVFTTSVSTATGGPWLSATLVGSNQLSVAVNPASLAQGDYQGTILVSAGTGAPATISVVLRSAASRRPDFLFLHRRGECQRPIDRLRVRASSPTHPRRFIWTRLFRTVSPVTSISSRGWSL